jgi:hypothetical protein
VVGEKVKVEEVNDLMEPNSVDEISNGSAQDEGEGESEGSLMLLHPIKEVKNQSNRDEGDRDEEERTDPSPLASKDPKGSAGISQMGEIKKSIDDFDGAVERNFSLDFVFRILIHDNDKDKTD